MTLTTAPRGDAGTRIASPRTTLRWMLKRALLGIVILVVTVTCAAVLLDAGIEPDDALANPDADVAAGTGPALAASAQRL